MCYISWLILNPDSYKESNEDAPLKNDFDYNLGFKAIILNFLDKRHLIPHKIIS
jgi:hypothetical protein